MIAKLFDISLERGGDPDHFAIRGSDNEDQLFQSFAAFSSNRPSVIAPCLENSVGDVAGIPLPEIFKNKVLRILSEFHFRKILMNKITKSEITEFLKKEVSKECNVPLQDIDVNLPFVDFHMDSLKAVYIMDRLEKYIGEELSPLYFWDNPTIDSLSGFLVERINHEPPRSE